MWKQKQNKTKKGGGGGGGICIYTYILAFRMFISATTTTVVNFLSIYVMNSCSPPLVLLVTTPEPPVAFVL